MNELMSTILFCLVVIMASACATPSTDQTSTVALRTEILSGGTPAAPTPPKGATPVPWFGATIARLDAEPSDIGKPTDLIFTKDGTIFVADIMYHRILRIDTKGKVLNTWGQFSATDQGQKASSGTFNEPWGLAASSDDLLYVTDTWNHRVQVFRFDGTFIKTWGEPGQGTDPYQFFGPRDIAINSAGFVLVTDTGNKRIVVYQQDGQYVSQLGGDGIELGQFNEPVGIAISSDGDVYVADQGNRRVQILSVTDDGTLIPITSWPVDAWKNNNALYKPYICVLEDRVFITDTETGSVHEYSKSGK